MPQVKDLDSSAQLMNHYVLCAMKFAKASRAGREKGDAVQERVACEISGRYMSKIRLLKESIA